MMFFWLGIPISQLPRPLIPLFGLQQVNSRQNAKSTSDLQKVSRSLSGWDHRSMSGVFLTYYLARKQVFEPFGMIRMDSDVMCVIFRARATKPFRSMLGKLGTWSSRNEISRREHALGQNKVSRVSNLWYLELNLARI